MKFRNPITQRIYDIIMDDIHKNKNQSKITNAEVWKCLGTNYSINSVRDKVQILIKQGYFKARYEFHDGDVYHNRMLYPGK
jgi:hypothetical protein